MKSHKREIMLIRILAQHKTTITNQRAHMILYTRSNRFILLRSVTVHHTKKRYCWFW